MIIIQSALIIVSHEIERATIEMRKYGMAMDRSVPFSQEYWKNRDKHEQCLIEISCLTKLKEKLLNGEWDD